MRQLEHNSETAAHWSTSQYDALFSPNVLPRLALVATEESPGAPILGFLIARCPANEWEIENVVVDLGCRKSGLATSLVRELLAEARTEGVASIILEVRESNRPALQLYEKIGFKHEGRRKDYYQSPPEDAILFRFLLQTCDKIP